MSSIHVLDGDGSVYRVVVHSAAPSGNNGAGIPWKTAYVNAGLAKTVMAVGTGPGQISSAEKASIEAGDVFEGVFAWGPIEGATNPEQIADLDLRATQLISHLQAELADRLRYYGFTRT